jgi:uncharacterized protein YbjT (DUF2867 family)
MATPEILVTGASVGRQGATGNQVARMLLERGIAVRALVHRDDERSNNIRALGAEIVEGDLLDLQFVRNALSGIRRAYFAYPVQDGLLDATAGFAAIAREAGLEFIVNLSQLLSRRGDQPTPHQKRHWLSEQIFDWADIGAVHLDATVFYENLRALARGSLARAGAILLPWGPESTTLPMVAAEDVARVAVGLLLGPVQPKNTVLPLIGCVVTIRDIMAAFSEALGKPIQYREITDEQWVQNVAGAGLNTAALEHLTSLWRYLRTRGPELPASYQVTDTIERIGGQPPKSLRQFLAEQAHLFSVGGPAAATAMRAS